MVEYSTGEVFVHEVSHNEKGQLEWISRSPAIVGGVTKHECLTTLKSIQKGIRNGNIITLKQQRELKNRRKKVSSNCICKDTNFDKNGTETCLNCGKIVSKIVSNW